MEGLSVVILSYTRSEKIHRMTLDCIRTLIQSEDFVNTCELEIILVESNRNYLTDGFAYPDNVKVIVPAVPFNFHAYLNIGIQEATQTMLALCNNDLIFHQGWYTAIAKVQAQYPKFKSFCPVQPEENIPSGMFLKGYDVRKHFKGWCLVAEKILFDKIGLLDEQFDFYYADDDYAMTLKKHHIPHALVLNSIVEHIGGENTATKKEEGADAFKDLKLQRPDLPTYLYTEGYSWILKNEKLLDGHLKFHKKWGTIKSLSIKNKLYGMFSKVGLGALVQW
ncbi:MAG: hypothetical protein PSX81_10310 [bacterium]|nr:hypothetical protein [bacterium]